MLSSLTPISSQLWNDCFVCTYSHNLPNYSHLHLVKKENAPLATLQQELKRFYELAHDDARQKFNSIYNISLDPLGAYGPLVTYPNDLPDGTQKGFFGEVFCGIICKSFSVIGHPAWNIPAFLFRYHDVAGQFLHRLNQGENPSRQIVGRTGDDFLALAFNDSFEITNCLVAEAKCHTQYSTTVTSEGIKNLNGQSNNPVSLGQLKDVLRERGHQNLNEILSGIDKVFERGHNPVHDRTDMFLFAFECPHLVQYNPPTRLSPCEKHREHTINRPLQVVEIHFPGMMSFVSDLYASLYR